MGEHVANLWCPNCDTDRRATSARANHLLHLLVIVFCVGMGLLFGILSSTAGLGFFWGTALLWLVVWFFVASMRTWRCGECGVRLTRTRQQHERDVERQQKREAAREAKAAGRAKPKPSSDPSASERIPPKPSALRESEYAEWMRKYGGRDG